MNKIEKLAKENNIKYESMEGDNYTAIIIQLKDKTGEELELHYTQTGGESFSKLTPRANGMLPYGGYYVPENEIIKELKSWLKAMEILWIKVANDYIDYLE